MPKVIENGYYLSADGKALVKCSTKEAGTFTIPNGVECVKEKAFFNCNKITTIVCPDSLIKIENHAFQNCTELETIIISKSVREIDGRAFDGCGKLKRFEVDPDNGTFTSDFDPKGTLLLSKDKTKVFLCAKAHVGISYLPRQVDSIAPGAFSDCAAVTSVNLPGGITEIPPFCFENCSKLYDVCIPYGVKMIGYRAFSNCGQLTRLSVPITIEELGKQQKYGYSAFIDCSNLKSIAVFDRHGVIDYIDATPYVSCEKRRFDFPKRLTACEEVAILKDFFYDNPISISPFMLQQVLLAYRISEKKKGILKKRTIHTEMVLSNDVDYINALEKVLFSM